MKLVRWGIFIVIDGEWLSARILLFKFVLQQNDGVACSAAVQLLFSATVLFVLFYRLMINDVRMALK
jgi:hypothetical protein